MPAANVKATLISERTGQITGLGVCIEATSIDNDADAIRAAFATAFDILRQAVDDQIARLAAPAAPAVGADTRSAQDAPTYAPPIDPPPTPAPIADPVGADLVSAPAERPSGVPAAGLADAHPPRPAPPETPEEARDRFYARYGMAIGGNAWQAVCSFHGWNPTEKQQPKTIEHWLEIAYLTREEITKREYNARQRRAAVAAAGQEASPQPTPARKETKRTPRSRRAA